MENILQICMPEDTLKKLHKNQLNDEQIVMDMLLGSLDPHSSFMNPEMNKELNTGMQGRFGGIGAEITVQNGVITVVSPIDDTPAYFAGIKPGDQIVKINNLPTKGMTAWEAAGTIHTDIQKGFIRAEVISFADFIAAGGETQAKRAGKQRLELKQYVVQDYDLLNFRFNK